MSRTVLGYLMVFLGAGAGGMMRHAANRVADAVLRNSPAAWSTLAVNVLGGFLMGVAAGWLALRGEGNQLWRLFFTTGVLGGFTTFSAFTLEIGLQIQRGHTFAAAAYILASISLCVLALFAGMSLMRA